MDEIRVLVVDDQQLVRNGLKATLSPATGVRVIGECVNGVDAIRSVRALSPDIVLMDLNMPVMGGLEATRRITEQFESVQVVVLSLYDRDQDVFEALRVGASGYILKDMPADDVIDAIKTVARGDAMLSPPVTRRLIAEFARRPMLSETTPLELARLTDRELDMLRLIVRGFRNEDIARLLVVGESTVKSHVQHLYQKLGVRDRVQVVIYAYEHGLVQPRTPEFAPIARAGR